MVVRGEVREALDTWAALCVLHVLFRPARAPFEEKLRCQFVALGPEERELVKLACCRRGLCEDDPRVLGMVAQLEGHVSMRRVRAQPIQAPAL